MLVIVDEGRQRGREDGRGTIGGRKRARERRKGQKGSKEARKLGVSAVRELSESSIDPCAVKRRPSQRDQRTFSLCPLTPEHKIRARASQASTSPKPFPPSPPFPLPPFLLPPNRYRAGDSPAVLTVLSLNSGSIISSSSIVLSSLWP
jgi:hypothetical protein